MTLVTVVGFVCTITIRAQEAAHEFRLKAAFLYQFPQFVDWPPSAWQNARDVQMCVLQPNVFGVDLDELVRGELLRGRPVIVREISGPDGVPGCHVLYVGRRSERTAAVIRAAVGRPVLTVGESDTFLNDGGIIALSMVDRRIRFDISTRNAEKAGLRISSQLLMLARTIDGGPS